MKLVDYHLNSYCQFYDKAKEVEYFLQRSLDNHSEYVRAPIPRDFRYFQVAQFYFSAFMNSLISTWEISRLTISTDNVLTGRDANEGIVSERKLAEKKDEFLMYFSGATEQDYHLFRFLKHARNACAHDGTITLNGGTGDAFRFMGNLERFELVKAKSNKKEFVHFCIAPPQEDAIRTMLLMSTRLVPLFESKLRVPDAKPGSLFAEIPELQQARNEYVPAFVNKYSAYL